MHVDTIYLDLDGVCCDFLSAALRLHNLDPEAVWKWWPAGEWDVCRVLDMTPANFWAPINDSVGFWAQLEPYNWFASLYAALADLGEVIFLTTPHDCAASWAGKQCWIRNRGFGQRQVVMTPRKELLARPSAVLIDDNDQNVGSFALHGGKAITFPQQWNSHHELADGNRCRRVVRQVRKLAGRLEQETDRAETCPA